ncbi:MAG: hypothetical protein M1434_14485 [Chloroflexi bacterium]|nr:hypothetical protein [Chloroflexota bacterium]MCL5275926.1 hypothetical protein [Chloroflexota bacterium]
MLTTSDSLMLLLITVLSLITGTAGVIAAYRYRDGRLIRNVDQSPYGVIVRETLLFLFMVGIPFVALISGATGVDLMALGTDLANPDHVAGFTFANWVRGFGVVVVAVTGIVLLLRIIGKTSPRGKPWATGAQAIRDAVYNEAHWVFYRNAPALLLNDPYWGVVIGTAAVLIEWFAHPLGGGWLHSIESRQRLVLRLACLLCSAFLYLATQNLWLMILADLSIQVFGSRVLSMGNVAGQDTRSGPTERSPAP